MDEFAELWLYLHNSPVVNLTVTYHYLSLIFVLQEITMYLESRNEM